MRTRHMFHGAMFAGLADFQNRMGSIFLNSGAQQLSMYGDWGIFLFRAIIATIFLAHGFQKAHFWHVRYADTIPKHTLMLFRVTSFYEVVSAIALFMGFFIHIVALGLMIIMLGGIYYKHVIWRKNFTGEGGWELDLIMLVGLILIFFIGAGRYSFDRMILGI